MWRITSARLLNSVNCKFFGFFGFFLIFLGLLIVIVQLSVFIFSKNYVSLKYITYSAIFYERTNGTITALDPLKRGVHELQAYQINCIPFYYTLEKQNRYGFYLDILVGLGYKVYNSIFPTTAALNLKSNLT